ncbi:hypothetical protein RF679_15655 [Undibacterium cyanobacteriorum]|uniref:Uncharacterized protein n=1 Tax=Undibacterium cyanobacteriorum TaxID=3073561 RepID=A0ABY9RFS6_9BURK|nr:hypothetical protein [Undibacterium sp. 20NA77.5]WMW80069.1 hypothetical protein RF679_15655 [Undibacterium sp. 20NA77.5]
MNRDFEIVGGIYLVQGSYELDLHNNFRFMKLDYSVAERRLVLNWQRSKGDWVKSDTPAALTIEFKEVSEFRFMPRDPEIPFTEDDCINSFGYWVDEDWAEGVIIVEPDQKAEPQWLSAIDFMSGAVLAVQAVSAKR